MPTFMIRGFTAEGAAKAYFQNKVVESSEVDGVMLKTAGQALFRQDNGDYKDLTDGAALYLVMTYPRETGILVDTAPASAVPAEEPVTKTAPEPATDAAPAAAPAADE